MANYQKLHDWDVKPARAIELQNEWRAKVKIEAPQREIYTIAGCDISFNKFSETIYAGIVVWEIATQKVIEQQGVVTTAQFPYIPGLLSFREVPALLEAWAKLESEPDAVMLDGQGIAHPRRIGVGAHFGLLVERPTIGCAKSVLVGKFDDPEPQRGSWSPMIHKGETVGAALRTKNKVQPVYISPGHLMDLPTAIDLALQCDGGYRVPEPTRQAHLYVNELRIVTK
jgi:deoxyribonuclease V